MTDRRSERLINFGQRVMTKIPPWSSSHDHPAQVRVLGDLTINPPASPADPSPTVIDLNPQTMVTKP